MYLCKLNTKSAASAARSLQNGYFVPKTSSDAAPEDASDGPEMVDHPPYGLARTRQRDPPAAEAPEVKAATPATRGSCV